MTVLPMHRRRLHKVTPIVAYEPDGTPVVLCKVTRTGWIFWCDFCRKDHTHSIGPGHRVAHCHNYQSRFYATGYVLTDRLP